jgi:hypothetical protein
VVSLVGTLS